MRAALELARRGLGTMWPNPAVGCVIVKDGEVVGRGWTQPGGRPHGETEALARAGGGAQGRDRLCQPRALRTSRPDAALRRCADRRRGSRALWWRWKTPTRVCPARGLARLRDAGIAVETGLCAKEAGELNAGFFKRIRRRPAARHAEARGDARRPHRDIAWREPVDHRRSGAQRAAHLLRASMTR